jgi:hypothetical protein
MLYLILIQIDKGFYGICWHRLREEVSLGGGAADRPKHFELTQCLNPFSHYLQPKILPKGNDGAHNGTIPPAPSAWLI